MEYQVSARKYRPMTFDSVVGQQTLTTTLKNAVKSGKLAHAFLFCGPRGVGKTTCARIFARTINCEHPTADGEACGECESCRAFLEQRSYNIFELDAASNNSVENIKQLMEQTRIPPQIGRYKVFIIDEVHMLSTQAFNAFLKTLEEPPSYVIFILATTEKKKLLPTILSRCQIYDFDRMNVPNTIAHLKMVAEKEGYTYEEEALEIIAEKADGGMRDALSLFDQAASFCQGNITREKVIKDFNLMDADNYFSLVDLALENKCPEVMLLLNNMLSQGIDGGNIVCGLAAHIRNVMMCKDPQTTPLLEASKKYTERYITQAQKCPPAFLYKALQILTKCDLNYRQSSNKRLLVEITLIEVAQITQPDEAGCSPRKGRRLKTLFKKILASQQKTAQQVAGDTRNGKTSYPTKENTSPENREEKKAVESHTTLQHNGKMSEKGIGKLSPGGINSKISHVAFSSTFGAMSKNNSAKVEKYDTIPETVEDKTFTEEDLARVWLAMCNRMAKQDTMIGLAASMRNLTPKITSYPEIEILVTNSILLEQLKGITGRIRATLAEGLHNTCLTVSLRIAENFEIKRVQTKQEILERIKKGSPSLRKMIADLALELT